MTQLLERSHTMAAEHRPTSHRAPRRALSRAAGFWLVGVMTVSLLAASSAPSPLYPVLQAELGFSALTLTAIFAAYVVALLVSLLTVGRLSDHLGRRPVLAAALLVEAVAMAIFWGEHGVTALLVARIVQGLATGAAVGVLGAYLLDLQPGDGSRLGSLVNSAAPTAGLGIGSLATGLLVQYAPAPTRLVFAILTVLILVMTVAVIALPETVQRAPGALAALRPSVGVPAAARRAFAGAVPTMVATWALGGLMLSLGGSLLATTYGQSNHAVVGAVLGLFAASGAVACVLARDLAPETMSRWGVLALVVGVAGFLASVAVSSLVLLVVSAVIAGGGFGAAFLGALRAVTQLAAPHERASLLSAVYIVSYLAFSVPAVVAGVLVTHLGLHDTALVYGGFVAVVAVGALALQLVLARAPRTAGA